MHKTSAKWHQGLSWLILSTAFSMEVRTRSLWPKSSNKTNIERVTMSSTWISFLNKSKKTKTYNVHLKFSPSLHSRWPKIHKNYPSFLNGLWQRGAKRDNLKGKLSNLKLKIILLKMCILELSFLQKSKTMMYHLYRQIKLSKRDPLNWLDQSIHWSAKQLKTPPRNQKKS